LALLTAVPGLPQSTFGTILGSVTDPAGAAMPGVKVTVTTQGTAAKEALTGSDGRYEVTHLNPSLYTVAAESPGFQRYLNQGINLETGQGIRRPGFTTAWWKSCEPGITAAVRKRRMSTGFAGSRCFTAAGIRASLPRAT